MKFLNKLIPLCLLLWLSGCLGTKHLQENELLLVENNIKGNEQISNDQLDDFFRQEPNLQFPLIPWAPYVSIYYLGENFHNPDKIRRKREEEAEKYDERIARAEERGRDSRAERLEQKKRDQIDKRNRQLEEGNLLMRFGEPIVVFDSNLAHNTAQQMEQFLESKGFFHSETGFEYEADNQKVSVTYLIEENKPFIIDSLYLTVSDENIRRIIQANRDETYLDTLQRYDEADMSQERTRIDNLLKNNGYYEFSPQYIEFNVDSTLGNHRVAIETRIFNPAGRGSHKQFRVDSVIFTTDATIRGDLAGRLSRTYNGISYRFFEEQYSKRVLNSRVFIKPDSLYSRKNTLETQKQLANLDIFKFININYDTTDGQFNAQIFTSPLKRFQTNNEIGFTYSQHIPGPYFNSTWTNRNTFGGLEILQLNLRAGIEGVPSTVDPTQAFGSNQAGANLSLTFPQFIAPLNPRTRTRLGELNPKTRISIGGAFTDRIKEFRRTNFNSSLTYNWQTERQRRENVYNVLYNFTPIDVSVIDSEIYTDKEEGQIFQNLLKTWERQGNPYIRSFDPSFVSSIYAFAVFTSNNYGTYTTRSRYIRPFVESGGTTQNLIDFPLTAEGEDRGGNLRSFRFLRFSNDYREYYPMGENTAFAFRINAGVGVPYGGTQTLPYEKFFFAGGSNSIRAFRPRRLGPGVYTPEPPLQKDGKPSQRPDDAIVTNQIEQPGEILLEGSLEYRHNIFGFLNGAVFLDFGNIWRIRKSEAFPGGEFRFDEFYKQIALGSGYGLRLDFSFLIVRFDFGLKMYNPQNVTMGPDGNWDYSQGWMFDKMKFPLTDLVIFNLGIGYPF